MSVEALELGAEATGVSEEGEAVVVAEVPMRFEPAGGGGRGPVGRWRAVALRRQGGQVRGGGADRGEIVAVGGETTEVAVEFYLGEGGEPGTVGGSGGIERFVQPSEVGGGGSGQFSEW